MNYVNSTLSRTHCYQKNRLKDFIQELHEIKNVKDDI